MFSNSVWNERYQEGKEALPWDTGSPATELVEYFAGLAVYPKRALEIGCGTGTNSIWMAEQGVSVVATDVSPVAIETAKEKCSKAGVTVDFLVSDIVEQRPRPEMIFNFVFDRGVYHVMAPEHREVFVDRVAAALDVDGYWLCLAGSADEKRLPEEKGPPQLKASDLVDNVERKFELHRLERTHFILPGGKPHLAWKALFRKRVI
jgi:cyclopropane fatty-acyl-phospholipid synthase-like methyltransferase